MQSNHIAAKPLDFENMNTLQDTIQRPKLQPSNDAEALVVSRNELSLFTSDLDKHTACYAWLFYHNQFHNYWFNTNGRVVNVVPISAFCNNE